MSNVGEREILTQKRVIEFFKNELGYDYLGDWKDREDNHNIEEEYLHAFLKDKKGYDEDLIDKAIFELRKVTGDQSRSLYDINKDVYSLLRYGVKVTPEAGENMQTLWLIDGGTPGNNHFALAEEVTVSAHLEVCFPGGWCTGWGRN